MKTKWKIGLLIVASMAFGGIVSSASMNGVFEGNPIVKVMTYGDELTVEGTPAINYKGRTMVPIYMLRQLGVNVEWDGANETVHVELPAMDATYDAALIAELTSHLGVSYVEQGAFGDGSGHLTVHYTGILDEIDEFAWETILQYSTYTTADTLYVQDADGTEVAVEIPLIRQYFDGSITTEALVESYVYYDAYANFEE